MYALQHPNSTSNLQLVVHNIWLQSPPAVHKENLSVAVNSLKRSDLRTLSFHLIIQKREKLRPARVSRDRAHESTEPEK